MIFQKVQKIVGVSDFRSSIPAYFEKARKNPVIITVNRGGDPFVLLSGEVYNMLVEARESDIDSRELARLVRENKGRDTISWESVRRGK